MDLGQFVPEKQNRFSEPAKFLPVSFVVCNIIGLYAIYMTFHLVPLLHNSERSAAIVECVLFNYITTFLVICYIRCILVHPGTIPEKEVDPTWEYIPRDHEAKNVASLNLQETKRSGDRRHCKWCAKYKPDRCHHCRVCRTCILKMDHHCPWIYNCVGFGNHKYFFLLLIYAVIDCHLIAFTMLESVQQSIDSETPFIKMFLLLFGETLAAFLGVLLTAFLGFHIYLMSRGMTTIEFCEKQLRRSVYDTSLYDRGCLGNVTAVLGDNFLLWFFPISPPSGDGMQFLEEDSGIRERLAEVGRGKRGKAARSSSSAGKRRRKRSAAGTGSAPSSGSGEGSGEASGEFGEESTCSDQDRLLGPAVEKKPALGSGKSPNEQP